MLYKAEGHGFMKVGRGIVEIEPDGILITKGNAQCALRYRDIAAVTLVEGGGLWSGGSYIVFLPFGAASPARYDDAWKLPYVLVFAKKQLEFKAVKARVEQRMADARR